MNDSFQMPCKLAGSEPGRLLSGQEVPPEARIELHQPHVVPTFPQASQASVGGQLVEAGKGGRQIEVEPAQGDGVIGQVPVPQLLPAQGRGSFDSGKRPFGQHFRVDFAGLYPRKIALYRQQNGDGGGARRCVSDRPLLRRCHHR